MKIRKIDYLIFLLYFVVFYPVYPSLISAWFYDSNSSHCILVPFISGYLIWKKVKKLKETPISNSSYGLILLLFGIFIYLLGLLGDIALIYRSSTVLVLIGLIWYNYGSKVFKTLLFPLCFLFFMIPIPTSLVNLVAFPMQLFATKVSTFIISLLGYPVIREGNIVHFPNISIEVAEACSGIRSLVSLIMLGTLFAYFLKGKYFKKVFLVISAIPIAIGANIFRVTLTGILAYYYGKKVARGFLHEFSGILVFALGFIIFLIIYQIIEKYEKKPSS